MATTAIIRTTAEATSSSTARVLWVVSFICGPFDQGHGRTPVAWTASRAMP